MKELRMNYIKIRMNSVIRQEKLKIIFSKNLYERYSKG